MNTLDVAIVLLAIAAAGTTYRMVVGPSDADRAVAADLLLFAIIALMALFGVRAESSFTLDIVLAASFVGFLGALSLARALTLGHR